jgi:hypothetical protein
MHAVVLHDFTRQDGAWLIRPALDQTLVELAFSAERGLGERAILARVPALDPQEGA